MSLKTPMNFSCEYCNITCSRLYEWNRHILTAKHLKTFHFQSQNLDCENNKTILTCNQCKYSTYNKSDYNKHLKTKRHLKHGEPKHYSCQYCKNKFNNYKKYWYHCKKCIEIDVNNTIIITEPYGDIIDLSNNDIDKTTEKPETFISIINKLLTDNRELRNFVIEQSNEYKKETKDIVNKMLELSAIKNTIVTNTINSNITGNITNNKMNVNVFLNEKCKDAMNLTDFIDTVQITDTDLENNANLGFVGGMAKILLDNLKNMSIYQRPIHCTDVKRETIYIKDENKWEKEEDMKKLKTAIQEISRKSMVHLSQWREENPEYVDLDSELGVKYILMNQTSIAGNNRELYHNKIIKTVAKETIIDKQKLLDDD